MASRQARSPTGAPSYFKLSNFPSRFQPKDLTGPSPSCASKLTPRRLFQCVVQLVTGSNGEGYWHALVSTFGSPNGDRLKEDQGPAKSALLIGSFA